MAIQRAPSFAAPALSRGLLHSAAQVPDRVRDGTDTWSKSSGPAQSGGSLRFPSPAGRGSG